MTVVVALIPVTPPTVSEELSQYSIGADHTAGVQRTDSIRIGPEFTTTFKVKAGKNDVRGRADVGTARRLSNGPLDQLFASAPVTIRQKLQGSVEGKFAAFFIR